ncbi:MAG: TlpA family protein disulfide reductase, partial [Deltaproteobacteria bacterium]|nr:TlpA family protein disulfide reductase [Deltaproteobacteria bacterium]
DVTPERTPETSAMMRQLLVDRPAPAFAASLVTGPHAAKLADHLGHVVILDFWATWCGPCRLTIPRLNAWQKQYGSTGLRIVGVSGESADDIRGYSTEHKLEYTVARDDGDLISRDYLVPAIPMLVVIDRQGVVRGVGLGAGDLDIIEALVVRLLK